MKISLIQYPLQHHLDFTAFCEKMSSLITQSADIHLFPELHCAELLPLNTNSTRAEKLMWLKISEKFNEYVEFVKQLSIKKNSLIIGGTFPRKIDNDIFNCTVIAFPDGKVILQNKIFLTQTEHSDWNWKTGSDLYIFKYLNYDMCVLICYDSEFPQITQTIAPEKPALILVPSCTSAIHGYHRVRWSCQCRAVEHFCYVAGTGTVGSLKHTSSFTENYGQSYVISPCEEEYPHILLEGPLNQSHQSICSINIDKLISDRTKVGCYPTRDQETAQKTLKIRYCYENNFI